VIVWQIQIRRIWRTWSEYGRFGF